jgi:lipopolysaccharide transport system permease protein
MLLELAQDIWNGRELAWRLFLRDLRANYRQTFLGYAWTLLPPLAAASAFIFLQVQGITRIQTTGIPYAAFALTGTLLWQIFVDALISPSSSLGAAKSMLVKINFPREAVLMGGLLMVLFNALIRILFLAAVVVLWGLPVGPSVAFLPVAVFGLLVAGFALGICVAPVSSLYGDVGRAIPIIAGFWMLLTPVVYPPQTAGIAGWLSKWNPVSPLITMARECLTGGTLVSLEPFLVVLGASLIVLLFGLVGFRVAMPHVIERMGS